MTDKEKIRAEIERRKDSLGFVDLDLRKQLKFNVYRGLLSFIDSMEEDPKTDWLQELQERLDSLSKENFKKVIAKYSRYGEEEPVSEELEEAANFYADTHTEWFDADNNPHVSPAFKAGAKWQKAHLLKPADGDDLPEIDREVIALLDNGKVVFAHRPPEYWDGKNIITGKVTRHYPKTYDKGGWNIPNVKYWLDIELPKETEL